MSTEPWRSMWTREDEEEEEERVRVLLFFGARGMRRAEDSGPSEREVFADRFADRVAGRFADRFAAACSSGVSTAGFRICGALETSAPIRHPPDETISFSAPHASLSTARGTLALAPALALGAVLEDVLNAAAVAEASPADFQCRDNVERAINLSRFLFAFAARALASARASCIARSSCRSAASNALTHS